MTKQISKFLKTRFKPTLILSLSIVGVLYACAGNSPADENEALEPLNLAHELDVEANQFTVSQNSDTLLFGESGTVIYIEANSFETVDGETVDHVDFSLQEYYDLSDILVQDLSTESQNGMLETGGMIYIGASSEGKNVFLKPDKELIIHFPKNGNPEKMQLFSQLFADSPTNKVKWKEEKGTGGYEIDTLTPFIIKYKDLDSGIMETTEGVNIWKWLEDEIVLTEKERDYIRLRDVNIEFVVTKNGDVTQVQLEKKYDEKQC